MKILIISKVGTHPTTAGNRKIILAYTELFKQWGHEVFFLQIRVHSLRKETAKDLKEEAEKTSAFWGNHYFAYKESSLHKLYTMFIKRYRRLTRKGYYKCDDLYPWGLHKYVNKLNNKFHFDACIVNYYMYSKVLSHIQIGRKAIFTHDYFSYKDLVVKHQAEYATTPDEEAKALQRAPFIFAMQDEEAAFFQRLAPSSKILINYSNYDYQNQPIIGNHNLLFLSGPNIYNINGLEWFLKEIFPVIISTFPDVKLIIGGGICQAIYTKYQNSPYIKFYGYVENVNDFFMQGDVAINPTYQGTGLKIKTFESLSYDKATIVHPHSAIGIFRKDNSPLFVSDKAEGWVNALKYIWEKSENIQKIKEKNRQYIKDMNTYIYKQYKEFIGSDEVQ